MNELTINADDRFILFLPRPYDSQRAVVFGRVCLFVCLFNCLFARSRKTVSAIVVRLSQQI